MKLPRTGFHGFDTSLIPSDLKALPRASKRLMEVLLKGSSMKTASSPTSWSLDFCLSPVGFKAAPGQSHQVAETILERTSLASPFDPNSLTMGTGSLTGLDSSVVFRSIGYKSEPLAGFSELGIPFDSRRGIILNDGLGRVVREVRTKDAAMDQERYPGLYCSGWAKRGPTGVIASTMEDAFLTADAIMQDWSVKLPFLNNSETQQPGGWAAVSADVGQLGAKVMTWKDWQKIDEAEKRNGEREGRERAKFTKIDEMLSIAG
jgi:adrenodoxin-NADP+ reductase